MPQSVNAGEISNIRPIHQYYMDIINCMPNIVYWVDVDCLLKGCNNHFVKWLGLKKLKDFIGSPYDQMLKQLPWLQARIQAFQLDDMAVLFSGIPTYDVEEAPVYDLNNKATYYRSTRVPLFDSSERLTGLVVILVDITAYKAIERPLHVQYSVNESTPPVVKTRDPIRVLIVEDNVIAQLVEKKLMTALNCNVDIADSGDVAASLFVPGKYALVFMDIGLQDTSGYMVAKKIREMEKKTHHHVPIIALTTYQADVVREDCADYFMDDVVTKPLTTDIAIQLINHFVHK